MSFSYGPARRPTMPNKVPHMSMPPGMAKMPADRTMPLGMAKMMRPRASRATALPDQANPRAVQRSVMAKRLQQS